MVGRHGARALIAAAALGIMGGVGATVPASPAPLDEAAIADLIQAAARTDAIGLTADASRRLTTGVTIHGRGPFPFLIDTGATRSVLSDRLAAAMALPAGPELRMMDIVGVTSVPSVRLDSYQVGTRSFGPTLSPVVGQGDLGAAGMVGIDALAGQQVLIDIEHGRMSVIPPRSYDNDPNVIVVNARSKLGQLIMTDADVRGTRVSVVIDTGAQMSIGNPALLQALIRHPERAGLQNTVMTGVSGATAVAEIAVLPDFKLGSLTMADLPIAFADIEVFRRFGLDKRPAMLLGMDVIGAFRSVAIDFKNRKVRFLLARHRRAPAGGALASAGGGGRPGQAALSMPSSPSLR